MYIIKKTSNIEYKDISLREALKEFLQSNGIPVSALAEKLSIDRRFLERYISEGGDIKFAQAIKIMQVLDIEPAKFIQGFKNDLEGTSEEISDESTKLSFLYSRFDIPSLKEIGLIKKRAKIDEIRDQICSFFGFQNIYEYDTFAILPEALFSRSTRYIKEQKSARMNEFWLKCLYHSFKKIDNPNPFDRELLEEFVKHIYEYTIDEIHGYEKVILVLYKLGVTVLTQPYVSGTGKYGATMIIDDKPCVVITDMNKKYHKLWLSLLHELYHILNDYDMLQKIAYHITSTDNPDLFLNEESADTFALSMLIKQSDREELPKIIRLGHMVMKAAKTIHVHPSIIYGVYLEGLDSKKQSAEFKKYGSSSCLIGTEKAIKNVVFDPIGLQDLRKAIEVMRQEFKNAV